MDSMNGGGGMRKEKESSKLGKEKDDIKICMIRFHICIYREEHVLKFSKDHLYRHFFPHISHKIIQR